MACLVGVQVTILHIDMRAALNVSCRVCLSCGQSRVFRPIEEFLVPFKTQYFSFAFVSELIWPLLTAPIPLHAQSQNSSARYASVEDHVPGTNAAPSKPTMLALKFHVQRHLNIDYREAMSCHICGNQPPVLIGDAVCLSTKLAYLTELPMENEPPRGPVLRGM